MSDHSSPSKIENRKSKVPTPSLQIRRRVVTIAATTAAALSLSNCGTPAISLNTDNPPDLQAAPVVPQDTNSQVDAYAANANEALAKLDAHRLKAATEKSAPATSSASAAVTPPARETPAAPAPVVIVQQAPPAPPPPALFTPTVAQIYNLDGPLGPTLTQLLAAAQDHSPAIIEKPAEITADTALDFLRKQTAQRPTLNTALAVALLEQSLGKSHNTTAAQNLSVADQQLLTDLLAALDTINSQPASAAIADRAAPLVELAKKFQAAPAEPDLTLPKLALASRVDSYGVYTPVEPKFKSGEKHTVIVYCEVANFASKKSTAGSGSSGGGEWYETRLTQQETLATDDGLLVWRPNAEEVHDKSLNQRRDFYLVKKLTIPDNLAVGKYSLRMSVTDKTTNKIAIVTMPIEITSATTKSTAKAN